MNPPAGHFACGLSDCNEIHFFVDSASSNSEDLQFFVRFLLSHQSMLITVLLNFLGICCERCQHHRRGGSRHGVNATWCQGQYLLRLADIVRN